MAHHRLEKDFFMPDVWRVAQTLLGKIIVVVFPEGETAVRITETEAYGGVSDRACHAYGGRCTQRTAPMYEEGGTLYIYKCYGIHHMLNIVTGAAGNPCAVLIRAGEPLWGIELMKSRRKQEDLRKLTVGPGALTAALGIPIHWSGQSAINHPHFFLYDDGFKVTEIACGTRIGVEYAGADASHLWRYWISDSSFVSYSKRKIITFVPQI
ncbi:MAG: DNA-3-methyladenine glycosylase [Bacteroidia bacterium]|nr:DNA-3-methyladenine glycosylase [Bacteroidia bacterium]